MKEARLLRARLLRSSCPSYPREVYQTPGTPTLQGKQVFTTISIDKKLFALETYIHNIFNPPTAGGGAVAADH